MSLIILIAAVTALTGLAWVAAFLYETIARDGYGRRPAPRSHHGEEHHWQPPMAA